MRSRARRGRTPARGRSLRASRSRRPTRSACRWPSAPLTSCARPPPSRCDLPYEGGRVCAILGCGSAPPTSCARPPPSRCRPAVVTPTGGASCTTCRRGPCAPRAADWTVGAVAPTDRAMLHPLPPTDRAVLLHPRAAD
eukprot:1785342-Prymnesium_polylepis.2